ncbi:unnamed protein product [Moneuplotes crassus]|uniref:Uncharacterized protein n=1 Tax=Euplotes crassus TaxID=5936 RepID=A0AAD2CXP6_EUPCR|nr:unnamed protein product [Moneuplotes crassus]
MEIDTSMDFKRDMSPTSSSSMATLRNDRKNNIFKESAKKQLDTLPISSSKISIDDMVKATKRDSGAFGIDGYRIPTNFAIHNYSRKPRMYEKRNDWLTQLQKNKEKVPSPDKYDVADKMLATPKLALNKSARITLFEEHSKRKQAVPPPNSYNIVNKTHIKGYYSDKKADLKSFTDDIVRKELENPVPLYLPKIDITKPRINAFKISSLKCGRIEKIQKNDKPSAGNYDSPKGLTNITPNHNYSFSFSKGKKESIFIKKKTQGPDPGAYDLNKSDGFITKGAMRGWK